MISGQLVDNLHHLVVSVVVPHQAAVVLHRLQQARHLLHLLLPGSKTVSLSVLRIRIHMFLGLLDPDPDPLVRGMDPDPDPSIIKKENLDFSCFVSSF
jgi:hypothetical protein